jgi:Tfp pilus assembly protein PilF
MTMKQISALLCVVLLMTGCATPAMRDAGLDKLAPRKAEQSLSRGIGAYEDGDYRTASRLLQEALSAGLLLNSDKVAAHKYLAFMHCAESRKVTCRNEFRKALKLNPKFELAPAERGHPSWGPVFRALKQSQSGSPKRA